MHAKIKQTKKFYKMCVVC